MKSAMNQGSGARVARLVFAGLGAAATAAACSITVDLDGLSEGAPDGGATTAGGGGAECARAAPPSRPPKSAEDGALEFTSALRKFDFGENAPTDKPVGLDVDRACTCVTEASSCVPPHFAEDTHCDDASGIDNTGARALGALGTAGGAGVGSVFYSDMAEGGEWSVLVHVTAYNGLPDDDRVTVALYLSPGMAAAGGSPPAWGGQDAWPVASTSLVDGASVNQPKYADPNGYVAGGVLVASFPAFTLRMTGPNSNHRLDLVHVTMMGLLESPSDGLGYRVTKGVMGAVEPLTSVFAGLATFTANGQTLCSDGEFIFASFKSTLCDFVDISTTLDDPKSECNAVSFGMTFETFPAKLGAVAAPKPEMPVCPAEQDPSDDTCG